MHSCNYFFLLFHVYFFFLLSSSTTTESTVEQLPRAGVSCSLFPALTSERFTLTHICIRGEPVTLKCSYETSSQYVYLYWYRQYPSRALQYLLLRGARSWSDEEDTADQRFKSSVSTLFTELTVSELRLADTALYYCALRVGAQ
uniref:Ig-like domain-containing protein n=1 Tax=Pygocentrus nattereri TaxID=42514 RepID=A0AAR2L7V0_PYGNA